MLLKFDADHLIAERGTHDSRCKYPGHGVKDEVSLLPVTHLLAVIEYPEAESNGHLCRVAIRFSGEQITAPGLVATVPLLGFYLCEHHSSEHTSPNHPGPADEMMSICFATGLAAPKLAPASSMKAASSTT